MDLRNGLIHTGDRVVRFSEDNADYLCNICEEAINNTGYERRGCHIDRETAGGYFIKLSVLKKKSKNPENAKRNSQSYVITLTNFFNKYSDSLPKDHRYSQKCIYIKNIILSGLYSSIKELEKNNSFETAVVKAMSDSGVKRSDFYYTKQGYKKWKKAFYNEEEKEEVI